MKKLVCRDCKYCLTVQEKSLKQCPKCDSTNLIMFGQESSYPPYVAVRDSEENPDGTYTVDVMCQRCLLNYQVHNYKPKPHIMPKKNK